MAAGPDVDASNEFGPQSETYIALDTRRPAHLAARSNEIFRLPMRGYYSTDSGASWGGVDLPLPAAFGANGTRFGSDPSLAFDTQGNVFYSYIVVFFGNGAGVNGTKMAVARSGDGGKTYPTVDYFLFSSGGDHFNDKPMITADANARSPYKDSVYVAWDAASGGSSAGGIRFGRSIDHGASFAGHPHRRSEWARTGNRRGAFRRTRRRGVCRVERLCGARHRLQSFVRRRCHVGQSFRGRAPIDRVSDRGSSRVVPRDVDLSVLRRRSVDRCAPRKTVLLLG